MEDIKIDLFFETENPDIILDVESLIEGDESSKSDEAAIMKKIDASEKNDETTPAKDDPKASEESAEGSNAKEPATEEKGTEDTPDSSGGEEKSSSGGDSPPGEEEQEPEEDPKSKSRDKLKVSAGILRIKKGILLTQKVDQLLRYVDLPEDSYNLKVLKSQLRNWLFLVKVETLDDFNSWYEKTFLKEMKEIMQKIKKQK